MFAELMQLREAAQAAGRVKDKTQSSSYTFVRVLLRAMQGLEAQYGDEDRGLEDLADWLLWKRREDEEVRREDEQRREEQRRRSEELRAVGCAPGRRHTSGRRPPAHRSRACRC